MGWTRDQVFAILAMVAGIIGAYPGGKDIYLALSYLTSSTNRGEILAGDWYCRGACGDGSFDTKIIMVAGQPYFQNTLVATPVPGTIDHTTNTIKVDAWGPGGIGKIVDAGSIIIWNHDNNIWTRSSFSSATLMALGMISGAVLSFGLSRMWRLFSSRQRTVPENRRRPRTSR